MQYAPNEMAKQATTDKILTTARALYLANGVDKTTVEEIALRAGIARATVYRHFENRDELFIALMEREGRNIARQVLPTLAPLQDTPDYIIEGIVLSVGELSKNKLFALIFSPDNMNMHRLVFMTDRLTSIGLEIMVPVVDRAGLKNSLSIDFETLMEWILRTLISLITVPSPNTQNTDKLRQMLNQTMAPVLIA